LLIAGDILQSRAHFDRAIALYDPVHHDPLTTGFNSGAYAFVLRSWALWVLGYPEAALADLEQGLSRARKVGHAVMLIPVLYFSSVVNVLFRDYATAGSQLNEFITLAEEKSALQMKAYAMVAQGSVMAATGKALDAVQTITAGVAAWRSTGDCG